MKKYVVSITVIILLIAAIFIKQNKTDSKLISKERLLYNTMQEAIENQLDKNFVEFDAIYTHELELNQYIVIYHNAIEGYLCAAIIEELDNYFYWEKLTPYFALENSAKINNKGSYVIYPVLIDDTKLEICLGVLGDESIIDSNVDAHIINDKFFIIINKGKINVELL